ncbi:MAG: hypothetical protein Q9173_004633 [Seirophora scorigena]
MTISTPVPSPNRDMTDSIVTFPGAHNYSFNTERLLFRPLRLDDTAIVFALKSDPQVYYWTATFTEESQAEEWIRARLESKCYFSFCMEELPTAQDEDNHEEQPQVIGIVGGTHLPEIGYVLRPAYWGRGYATEAVRGFIKFYWETFPGGHPAIPHAEEKRYLKAVTGPPDEAPQARASIGVLKKCGFEHWKDQQQEDSVRPEQKLMLPVWRQWGPGYAPLGLPKIHMKT